MRRDRFWHDLGQAICEAVFYRRAIFDPPPWPKFRLFLPVKKVQAMTPKLGIGATKSKSTEDLR